MSEPPPSDALPICDVGPWVSEKHERLRRYVAISAYVRAKFVGPGKAGATFVDLFSGPGRVRDRESGRLLPGSTLVAAEAAAESGHEFSEIHVNDAEAAYAAAAKERLHAIGVRTPVYCTSEPAGLAAPRIVARLNPYALHVVFLDPFNLGALPFSVIEAFAPLRRVDLLMHVSAMDLQRNLEQAVSVEEGHQFDAFAPGWRSVVDVCQPPHLVRRDLVAYWASRVRDAGLRVFHEAQFELIRGSRRQPLYWLALASKEEKAGEFWEKIRHIQPQRGLDF